jgi:hypothetical protein
MAKISLDVAEIKKELKARALTAKAQFEELVKGAQKDFSQKEVLKKIDQLVEVVKSQEFMKNPKVIELTKKVIHLSEQIEKAVGKNAAQIVNQVKAQVGSKLEKRAERAKEATVKAATAATNAANAAVKKAKSTAAGKKAKSSSSANTEA